MLAWATFTGGVIALFYLADHVAKQEVKSKVARWLQNLTIEGSLSNWPAQFGAVFDGIFGERHFSWRCFWRSCVASIISVGVIITLLTSIFSVAVLGLGRIVSHIIVFNFLPDYLSLLESRYVIKWLSKKDSLPVVVMLLIVDFIITAFIWQVWFAIIVVTHMHIVLNVLGLGSEPFPFWEVFSGTVAAWIKYFWLIGSYFLLVPFDQRDASTVFTSAMFYSTFFTSVWVWLYVCSGLTVRFINRVGRGLGIFAGFLDIEDKPILCIGFFACFVITILFLVASLIHMN